MLRQIETAGRLDSGTGQEIDWEAVRDMQTRSAGMKTGSGTHSYWMLSTWPQGRSPNSKLQTWTDALSPNRL